MRHGAIAAGLRLGALAAGATAGALAGFGLRLGAPAAAFSAAGDRLRGLPTFVAPDRGFGASAWVGAAHHAALLLAWGLLFTLVAQRLRGAALGIAAAATALVAVAASRGLPSLLRPAAGALSAAQELVLGVVLATTLGLGMRLAQRWASGAARV